MIHNMIFLNGYQRNNRHQYPLRNLGLVINELILVMKSIALKLLFVGMCAFLLIPRAQADDWRGRDTIMLVTGVSLTALATYFIIKGTQKPKSTSYNACQPWVGDSIEDPFDLQPASTHCRYQNPDAP